MIPLFKVAMSSSASEAVSRVLSSGYIGQGREVDHFEAELSRAWGTRLLTTNSGTAAIDLALHLAGVGPGDEVIGTPLTCTATNSHIIHRGATIVWADIDPLTGNISPESVRSLITRKTRAIVTVDWGGTLCNYAALRAVVESTLNHPIPIIQDAAHTLGGWSGDADYTCWSFQAIKFLTTGDGGALRVPDDQFARAKLLRWFGLDRESSASFRCAQNIREIGYKSHMNDIAATIGRQNLYLAHTNLAEHIVNAGALSARISTLRHLTQAPPVGHFWVYFLQTPRRDEFILFMAERGIEAGLVHARNDRHTGFAAHSEWRIPSLNLDLYSSQYVAIPCGWWVSRTELDKIGEALTTWNTRL